MVTTDTVTKITMDQATTRVYNFNAGPAALPLSVLEQARDEMLNFGGSGMSVLELSHRSKHFEDILDRAEADLRTLFKIPSNYKILFLQGGNSLQFAMLPMNFRAPDASADYVQTGSWSKKAISESEKLGKVRLAANTGKNIYIPSQSELDLDPQAAYLHFTANETIEGTEWATEPTPPPNVPLACDTSSNLGSRPLDVSKYGIIYAGVQKNLGPAGVTIVILREDLLERVPPKLPAMLDYKNLAEGKSLYNTPPCYSIYVVGLVLRWLIDLGGVEEIARQNATKATTLYQLIDASGGFYKGIARPDSRSRMNVTFRLATEELEKQFAKQATAQGLEGLKGHRSVGGMRASIYNAVTLEALEILAQFMKEFQRANG